MNRRSLMRTRFYAMAWAFCMLLSLTTHAANQWWDTSNVNGLTAGSNPWDTSTLTWATNASPGTTMPVAWVNSNDAVFAVANTGFFIGVGNVTANSITINSGSSGYVFTNAGGVLSLGAGGMTIYENTTFNPDISLTASQTWWIPVNRGLTVTGAVSGTSSILTKTGDGSLTVSNAANQFAGFVLKAGIVNAFNNSLGNSSSSALTLGGTDQVSRYATLALDTRVAGNNTFTIGNLTNAGGATLRLYTSAANSTNILSAQTLSRTGRATLAIIPVSTTALGANNQVFFTGGTTMTNGMLAPWLMSIPNASSATFVSNDVVKGLVPITYDGVKRISAGGTWNTDTNAYALQVVGTHTVNSTLTLGNDVFAGVAMNNSRLYGSGTLAFGAAELIVGIGNSSPSVIGLYLSGSGGLTLMSPLGQDLTISNMTYTGDTWINGGTLKVAPPGTTTYANTINGGGTLAMYGPGTLILTGNSVFNGGLLLNSGTLVFNGNTWTNYTASKFLGTGAQLVITNGAKAQIPFNWGGVGMEGTSNTLTVVGGGLPGVVSVLDLANVGFAIGSTAGSTFSTGNVVRVDGNGVVGGAVLTNGSINVGGANVSAVSNGLVIANGGRVFASGITVGQGVNCNYNYLNVGGGSATSRIMLGTGSGVLTVGNNGSRGNSVTATNAEIFGSFNFGVNASSNRVMVWADTVWNLGNNSLIYNVNGNSGVAAGNVVVVDGGMLTNVNTIIFGHTAGYPHLDGSLTVRNGARLFSGNVTVGNMAGSSGNAYNVGGPGLSSTVSNGAITVGNTAAGNNTLTVTNATLWSGAGTVGNSSSNNTATIQAGGTWSTLGNALTTGSGAATGNVVRVQGGGILEANSLVTGGTIGQGNVITNSGGVYQFTTATPTITTNGGIGTIAISDGVISFRGVTSGLNITNNTDIARLGRLAWSGNNALRLDNSIATNTQAGGYTFQTGNPAAYGRLEMINGTTKILGQGITVGATGSILFSNTTATIGGAFTNSGAMKIVDSQVTFSGDCVLQGGSLVLSTNAASFTPIAVSGSLTTSGSMALDATSVLAGKPAQVTLFTVTGAINAAAAWTVTPSTYRVSTQGQTLSLVPSTTGTVIMVR